MLGSYPVPVPHPAMKNLAADQNASVVANNHLLNATVNPPVGNAAN